MNAGTMFVLLILAVIVYICIRYLITHGIDSCGGSCSSCGSSCKWVNDVKKAQRKIRFQKKLKRIFHLQ